MTKEDYMNLSKQRLAELLAERDAIPFVPLQTWQTPCANPNYPCSNPYHDCINCPRIGSVGHYTTTIEISDNTKEQGMIRKEEINKAAMAYVHSNVGYTDHWGYEFEDAFKAGVEWADKHPDLKYRKENKIWK